MYYITLIGFVLAASTATFYAGYRHGFNIAWKDYMRQVDEAIDKFFTEEGVH